MLQVNHAYLVTQIVEVAMQDLALIVILAETLESYSKVHVQLVALMDGSQDLIIYANIVIPHAQHVMAHHKLIA